MQSKSSVVNQMSSKTTKHNKSFDYLKYYKPAVDPNEKVSEKHKSEDEFNSQHSKKNIAVSRNFKNNKKVQNESVDISTINIDGSSLLQSSGRISPVNVSKVTSTPKEDAIKRNKKVKSIMKNSLKNESIGIPPAVNLFNTKSKKRNKSVSFMQDTNEEVVVKKIKSNDSLISNLNTSQDKSTTEIRNSKKQKLKQRKQAEKENEACVDNVRVVGDTLGNKHKSIKSAKIEESTESFVVPIVENQVVIKKKKKRRFKTGKSVDNAELGPAEHDSSISNDIAEQQVNKAKKKKRHEKSSQETNDNETENEPAIKTSKKNVKPDLETSIQNLNIGDNAHTLTDLLDQMSVVNTKKKKIKKKKIQNQQVQDKESSPANDKTEDEKPTEEKEKVKWTKKWNKDKKLILTEKKLLLSIVVENLPLNIMTSYKKLLAEHFAKYGLVQYVGVAELYPSEDPKPVFTTTILFDSEDAATQALEEDNASLSGARLRVRRPLPPAQTTLVVSSHGALADCALSSAFAGAGRVRAIRHVAKSKKAMATAFIEFEGPESVERALKMAENVKIGHKKIYASKYNPHHTSKQTKNKPQVGNGDT